MWSLPGMAVAAMESEGLRSAPASLSDADLVVAFKTGNTRAFDALFARYRQPIFAYIYRSVGAAPLAEELTQDVFLKVFQYLRRTGENLSVRAWIYHIATTTCIDAYRAASRRPALVDDAAALMAAPGGIDPMARHLERERRHEVRSTLDALPAQYRQALVLRQLQGLAYAEIAEALGISVEAVTSLIHRARHAFRAAYAQQWKGEE
ncbi:MAG TPA: RNA polymerase sigma factor [Chloroflexota bacterium]|nr:RNA polymerase sigma factor [Chloroflexota bacterium]